MTGKKLTYLLLVVIGYAALITSWVFTNPPGAAPDEYAHYLRALGAGRGDFVLETPPPPLEGPALNDKALLWQQHQARMIKIPARLSPDAFNCRAVPQFVGSCPKVLSEPGEHREFRTWVGTYPPFVYAVPGVPMQFADSTIVALLTGRLASAMACLALLAVAAMALWDNQRPWSLTGLAAATTPMVLYVSSTLSASGPEIAAGIAFLASLLRLARQDEAPRWVWAAAGASGLVLTLSRDLGPVWLVLDLFIWILVGGTRKTIQTIKNARGAALVTFPVLAAAFLVAAAWQIKFQAHPEKNLPLQLAHLRESLGAQLEIFKQQIGVFGVLDAPLPGRAYLVWTIMVGLLIVLALVKGSPARRLALLFATAAPVAISAVLDSFTVITAFGAQGRHVLPLTVAAPLLAGEILYQQEDRDWTELLRWVSPIYLILAAVVHVWALFINSRRHSVGLEGPVNFLSDPAWIPPLGWPWWIAVTMAGAGVMVWSAALQLIPRRHTLLRGDGPLDEPAESFTQQS